MDRRVTGPRGAAGELTIGYFTRADIPLHYCLGT
jgi:hypothetical protein